MGKGKKRKMVTKAMIRNTDSRVKALKSMNEEDEHKEAEKKAGMEITVARQYPSHMFFSYNANLGPPYHVLLDTNFINFSIQNKIDIVGGLMDCLYAKCIPYITDCVMGELEKLGSKFRIAVRIARDPRMQRLTCTHKGTYADDCIVDRVDQHKCYIVGTCDKELKSRIRKIPGVPIMFIRNRKYTVERLPDALGDKTN